MNRTVTKAEAANILGVSKAIVTNMIDSGQLEALIVPTKTRRTIRIYLDSVEKFRRDTPEVRKEAV